MLQQGSKVSRWQVTTRSFCTKKDRPGLKPNIKPAGLPDKKFDIRPGGLIRLTFLFIKAPSSRKPASHRRSQSPPQG